MPLRHEANLEVVGSRAFGFDKCIHDSPTTVWLALSAEKPLEVSFLRDASQRVGARSRKSGDVYLATYLFSSTDSTTTVWYLLGAALTMSSSTGTSLAS